MRKLLVLIAVFAAVGGGTFEIHINKDIMNCCED